MVSALDHISQVQGWDSLLMAYYLLLATHYLLLDHIPQVQGWDQAMVWVWIDVISIPQRCKSMQLLAINSLSQYVSIAHAFVIVAPPVRHANTGMLLDDKSYTLSPSSSPIMPTSFPPSTARSSSPSGGGAPSLI